MDPVQKALSTVQTTGKFKQVVIIIPMSGSSPYTDFNCLCLCHSTLTHFLLKKGKLKYKLSSAFWKGS